MFKRPHLKNIIFQKVFKIPHLGKKSLQLMMVVEKRFNNNDFRAYFAKNGKFDDQIIREKFEKYVFQHNDFFKHSYFKFNDDFNAVFNFTQYILSY